MADDDITSLDAASYDPSKRAEAVLNHILSGDDDKIVAPEEAKVPVKEALEGKPILEQSLGRAMSRVLFVTTRDEVLVEGSAERQYYLNLAAHFDEVHILFLSSRRGSEDVIRGGSNLWVYPVRSKYWWSLPFKGKRAANENLTFGGGFRPDIVVGIDPFEAGLSAYMIAHKYQRPWQLHLHTDPYGPDYKDAAPDNNWRIRIANFVLRRVSSVRTSTGVIKQSVVKKFKRLSDVIVLPRFYNFTCLLNASPTFSLKEKYPDFAFIILAFGPLTATSHLHDTFAGIHQLLRNPRIGLIVIGDGPAKELFQNKTQLLGIQKSVVFHKSADDLVSYLKTADALIELDTDEESEVRVLQAASAELPIIAVETPLRSDLFKDGESALLCPKGDLVCIGQKLGRLINPVAIREQLTFAARFVAESRLHEDPTTHYQSIASSIETVLDVK